MSQKPCQIGITMGDAIGIGPEQIVKLQKRLLKPVLVYGDVTSMQRAIYLVHGDDSDIRLQGHRSIQDYHLWLSKYADLDVAIHCIQCGPELSQYLPYGEINADVGEVVYQSLCRAIDDAMNRDIESICTAPLNKLTLKAAGHDFPGHTEILATRSKTDEYAMMLLNHEVRVLLSTIHVPLSQVPSMISFEQQCRSIEMCHEACRILGLERAKIAVAGLNPHAGEGGRFGHEEIDFIEPAIKAMQNKGYDVHGPFPGDTIFMRARQGEFDVVLAQYHDQGLVAVKYMGISDGVNVTVGLPFLRTSVDHGTAYDIAGKGIADEQSLWEAYTLAERAGQRCV